MCAGMSVVGLSVERAGVAALLTEAMPVVDGGLFRNVARAGPLGFIQTSSRCGQLPARTPARKTINMSFSRSQVNWTTRSRSGTVVCRAHIHARATRAQRIILDRCPVCRTRTELDPRRRSPHRRTLRGRGGDFYMAQVHRPSESKEQPLPT